MKKIFGFILTTTIATCTTNNYSETKAYIFERKILNNGKLMVRYVFNTGKFLHEDSCMVENKVLLQDSVMVEFKKENPGESSLVN